MFGKFKVFVYGLISGLVLAGGVSFADNALYQLEKFDCSIVIDSKNLKTELPVLSYEGSTYIPLRAFSEGTGATVEWFDNLKTITIASKVNREVVTKEVVKEVPKEINKTQIGKYGQINVYYDNGMYTVVDSDSNNTGESFTSQKGITYYVRKENNVIKETEYYYPLLKSNASTNSNTIETKMDGDFEGFDSDRVYKLANGQIWKQTSYDYEYHYAYRPDVLIYLDKYGNYKMKVEGCDDTPTVTKLK